MLPDDPYQFGILENPWTLRREAAEARARIIRVYNTKEIERLRAEMEAADKKVAVLRASEAKFIETGELPDELLPPAPERYIRKYVKEAQAEHIKMAECCCIAEAMEVLGPKGWIIHDVSRTSKHVKITVSKDISPLDKEFVKEMATDNFNCATVFRLAGWVSKNNPNWSMNVLWQEIGRPDWADAPPFSYVGDSLADRVTACLQKWTSCSDTPANVTDRPP